MSNNSQILPIPSVKDMEKEIKDLVKEELNKAIDCITEEDQKKIIAKSESYCENLTKRLIEKVDNTSRDKNLTILYNHEKHLLDILKDYKEEIKFASSLQAEIRKEEASFFSSTLKEVCNSLKETQVSTQCQAAWILDLVSSYTSSLKLSNKLAEGHVINLIGTIQEETSKTLNREERVTNLNTEERVTNLNTEERVTNLNTED